MSANDGGPAFPRPAFSDAEQVYCSEDQRGMTLRDWFAGQALSGMLAADPDKSGWVPSNNSNAAKVSYMLADAMLAERNKGERDAKTDEL